MGNLESLAAVNKIGGWIKVLMKIFIKTSDICQESNLTKGPTNYVLLVCDDHLDSSCITFRQNAFRQFIETPLLGHCVKCSTGLRECRVESVSYGRLKLGADTILAVFWSTTARIIVGIRGPRAGFAALPSPLMWLYANLNFSLRLYLLHETHIFYTLEIVALVWITYFHSHMTIA